MAASSQPPGADEPGAFESPGTFAGLAGPPAASGGSFASSANIAVYGVGQIARYLAELLDTDPFLGDLWVAGEVTSLSRSQAGHLFFTLNDASGSNAAGGALRCAFFRQYNAGVAVEQGESVLVHGRVSLYAERGDLQIYVDALQPEGTGVLEAEFQRLFERLKADGLFDSSRKRSLPRYPRTVGVVTSAAGAVWHDIRSVMARRWPMAGLLLAPAAVQGEGAAASIARAIAELNAVADDFDDVELDVIIVARGGGGSADDLWAFNDERVARAIFASETPTVSAVGHETDMTLADYVADVRAPTPSAAAELVVPDQREERARVALLLAASGRALAGHADQTRGRLAQLTERMEHRPPDLESERRRVERFLREALAFTLQRVAVERAAVTRAGGRLEALGPLATLARGYAIVQDASGSVVRRADALTAGERLRLRFQDGIADAEVIEGDG